MESLGKGHSGCPSALCISSPRWPRLPLQEEPCGWNGPLQARPKCHLAWLLASCVTPPSLKRGPRLLCAGE